MDGNSKGWRLFCLLLCFGQCLSMQPGLEYHYRYSGQLVTGITEMMTQYAATAIRMDVTVQVEADYSFLIQFYDIQIGEFHDVLPCDYYTSELPFTYSDLQKGEEFLQLPFKIAMNAAQHTGTLEVPRDEPIWITNVKKAVIDVFPLAALWKELQLGKGERFLRPNFGAEEELIGGRCMNWYSVTKLPEDQAARVNKKRQSRIEEDVQRSGSTAERLTSAKGPGAGAKGPGAGAKGPAAGAKGPAAGAKGPAATGAKGPAAGSKTSQGLGGAPLAEYSTPVPPISDTLWKVLRTIDYDMCEEKLVTLKVNAPRNTQKLISRSSVAKYLIRGDQLGIRVEKGIVEGSISLFTSSEVSERIDTFTNQTVELRAVRRISKKISINYEVKRFRHWYFEFDHLTRRRTDERHWTFEETLTGIRVPESHFPELKGEIFDLMAGVHRNPRYLPDLRRDIAVAVSYLKYSQIKEIYEELESTSDTGSQDEQDEASYQLYNFHIALTLSGTEAAVNYLLDKVAEEDFLTSENSIAGEGIMTLYAIGMNTIKTPKVIPKMVEFAMTMSWEKYGSYNKATALTSVAILAQKFCFSADRRRTYSDSTCLPQHVCDTARVTNTFLPYLQEKIKESSNDVSRRVVYIQALVNLGLPKAIDVLAPIIMGSTDTDIGVRKIAIMGLSSHIMHTSTISVVYELLMPLIENRGEHPDIRCIAFVTLASWKPGLTWWKHMAFFTWHEPNTQVSSFVSSAITSSYANKPETSEYASRVIHLLKPAVQSLTHSFMGYQYTIEHLEDFGTGTELLWLASAEGLLPTHISLEALSKSLYEYPKIAKFLLHQQNLSRLLPSLLHMYFSPKSSAGEQDRNIVQEMITESLEQLGLQLNQSTNFQLWWTQQDLFSMRGYAADLMSIAQGLVSEEEYEYTTHYTWVDSTIALPTDIGLPIIITEAEDASMVDVMTQADVDAPSLAESTQKFGANLIAGYGFSTSIRVKTLVPWSTKTTAVGAGIHNFVDASLIVTLQCGLRKFHKIQPKGIVEASCLIQPNYEEPERVLHGRNQPYTVMYGTFPTLRVSDNNEYKTVNRYDTEFFNNNGRLLVEQGLHLEYSWESTDTILESAAGLFRFIFRSLPVHGTFEYQMVHHPGSSSVDSIELSFEVVSMNWPDDSSSSDDLTQFSQQSQGQGDFDDFSQFSQFSQSASQDYDDFQQQFQGADDLQEISQEERFGFTHHSVMSKLISQRNKLDSHYEFGAIYALGIGATLHGSSSPGPYQCTFFTSSGTDFRNDRHHIISFAKVGDESQTEISTLWSVDEALVVPFKTAEEYLSSNLQTKIEGTVALAHAEGTVELTFDVTDNQITQTRDTLANQCNFDTVDEGLQLLTTSLVDHFKIKANWDETFHLLLNITGVYNFIRPHVGDRNTEGDNGHEVIIDATKDLSTYHWTIQTETPNAVKHTKGVNFGAVFLPADFSWDKIIYEDINGQRSSYCTITDREVKTFDAFVYPAVPSNCWKVAAYDCWTGRAMFQVRKTDQWEVRVLWKDEGLVFDISNSDIMVNGDSFDERDERYRVIRQDDALLVIFNTKAAVRVSDKVEIHSPPELRAIPCGLCGNFDGEKTSEMIGPKGCVYTDAELFSYAWSVSGEGCNAFSLRGHRQKVERYQQGCPKRTYVPTGVSHSGAVNQCTSWQFINKMEGSFNCTAIIRTPKCKKGCVASYSAQEPIPFDCYGTEGQQQQANVYDQCYPRTITSTIPKGCRKQ